jgi:hypothetical protein
MSRLKMRLLYLTLSLSFFAPSVFCATSDITPAPYPAVNLPPHVPANAVDNADGGKIKNTPMIWIGIGVAAATVVSGVIFCCLYSYSQHSKPAASTEAV